MSRTSPVGEPGTPSPVTLPVLRAHLRPVLARAQELGFLGPGPVDAHVDHAWPLVAELPASGTVIDLGSGGGVPALPLAVARPDLVWVLVESQQRRATWLGVAVSELRLDARVEVWHGRAEDAGRSELRGSAAAVTARSFGPPAVTAECGAPLLGPGGVVWVSRAPAGEVERWPADGLAEFGLAREERSVEGWTALVACGPVPARFPRRAGVPAKRPLF